MIDDAPGATPGSDKVKGPASSVSSEPGTGAFPSPSRSSPSRTLRLVGLWLLVMAQVAIPASYYLVRADRDDERFAWRMFSAVRVKKCRVSMTEVQRDQRRASVDLKRSFHSAWVHALERGRERVIEAALKGRCQRGEVAEVVIERSCQDAARRALAPELARLRCDDVRVVMEQAP